MSCLPRSELPRTERQDIAIREAIKACGKRLRIAPFDREVAAQCAINAWRMGASPAAAVERGTRYLRALHGDRDGVA
ncbi:MAG: hypothetical protein ACYCOR_13760 [Acidobacteriaceae bacterium]